MCNILTAFFNHLQLMGRNRYPVVFWIRKYFLQIQIRNPLNLGSGRPFNYGSVRIRILPLDIFLSKMCYQKRQEDKQILQKKRIGKFICIFNKVIWIRIWTVFQNYRIGSRKPIYYGSIGSGSGTLETEKIEDLKHTVRQYYGIKNRFRKEPSQKH